MFYIPEKYDFAFLIIDDTDCSTLPNIKEIYDLLFNNGLRTNKTIWVYPARDEPKNFGDSLSNERYKNWIKDLQKKGFEIGIHNVGSGDFKREEIISGLNIYNDILGGFPKIHVNHSYNKDNIYSGDERFSKFLRFLINIFYPNYTGFKGNDENSKYFWGDYHKKIIKYSRNFELPKLDLTNYFSRLPYVYRDKLKYSNYWYPVTFAPNPWLWKKIVSLKAIDELEKNNGIAIVYTHFGYYHFEHNKIDPYFVESIEHLGSKNGWYVTLSEFLDYQLKNIDQKKLEIGALKELYLDLISLITRVRYRYFQKIDDLHFKTKVGLKW